MHSTGRLLSEPAAAGARDGTGEVRMRTGREILSDALVLARAREGHFGQPSLSGADDFRGYSGNERAWGNLTTLRRSTAERTAAARARCRYLVVLFHKRPGGHNAAGANARAVENGRIHPNDNS